MRADATDLGGQVYSGLAPALQSGARPDVGEFPPFRHRPTIAMALGPATGGGIALVPEASNRIKQQKRTSSESRVPDDLRENQIDP